MLQDVIIERLGLQGDGIAGGTRVPLTLPGERLRGTVTDGAMLDGAVLEPSADRVVPPCRHFGVCGGCALQHASDPFLAAWKADVVVRALAARELACVLRPTLTSPPRSRRRALLSGRRARRTAVVGFHARRSDAIVTITECYVMRAEILAARAGLEALVLASASRSNAVRLAVTVGPAGLDVDVGGGQRLDADLRLRLAALADAHALARLSWDGEVVVMARPPVQGMGKARVVPPPGAFLQATETGQRDLVAAVREVVGTARRVVDLFAGCGTFTLALAETAQVRAVEGSHAMLAALDAGWRQATRLKCVTTETRDLFRRPLLAAELSDVEAVVIDPPRAGAEAQCRVLAGSDVARIAAVSCNPISFARDAGILVAGGYRLDWVQVVDQFRWSGHVELAAQFSR